MTTRHAKISRYSKTVGRRLRTLREGLGLSLADVAKAIEAYGIEFNRTTWSHYEAGDRQVPVGLFPYIAAVLGVEMTDLLPKQNVRAK